MKVCCCSNNKHVQTHTHTRWVKSSIWWKNVKLVSEPMETHTPIFVHVFLGVPVWMCVCVSQGNLRHWSLLQQVWQLRRNSTANMNKMLYNWSTLYTHTQINPLKIFESVCMLHTYRKTSNEDIFKLGFLNWDFTPGTINNVTTCCKDEAVQLCISFISISYNHTNLLLCVCSRSL